MRVPTQSPWSRQGESVSRTERVEALSGNLVTQFQPMTDPSVPAVIEMVDVTLNSYFLTPASEGKLTNPDEFQVAIRGFKVCKAPGRNSIPNRALKHFRMLVVFLLAQIFNAVLLTHHFLTVQKHACVIYILKPWKNPAMTSSYWPISLLDTISKLL
jgi:hypothetical protein